MSERQTGATPEQIEAAVQRYFSCWMEEQSPENERSMHARVVSFARQLVPPGSLIFDTEDIAALRRVIAVCRTSAMFDRLTVYGFNHAERPTPNDDLNRLAALIGHPEGKRE